MFREYDGVGFFVAITRGLLSLTFGNNLSLWRSLSLRKSTQEALGKPHVPIEGAVRLGLAVAASARLALTFAPQRAAPATAAMGSMKGN